MTYAPLVVQDYDPRWPRMYADTKAEILRATGGTIAAIEHIGSTAIPGLAAKPLIDILVALRRFPEDIEATIAPLAGIGFDYVPKPRPDRYFFRKGVWGQGTQHLHIVEFGGEDWTQQLLFRDYLTTHPELAKQYAALKRQLATRFGTDRRSYTEEKTAFIVSALAAARRQQPASRG